MRSQHLAVAFVVLALLFINQARSAAAGVDTDAVAEFRAWLYEVAPPPDREALEHMVQRAQRGGDPEAKFWVHTAYRKGLLPVSGDDASVFQLLVQAADEGSAKAQAELAYSLALGVEVPADQERANELFKSALAAQEPHAFLMLGRYYLYEGEQGDARALAGAIVLLDKAAELGHQRAWAMLAHAHGLQDDWKRARELGEKSAAAGDPEGYRFLGHLYLHGEGVTPNVETAIQWLKKAADGGSLDAYRQLAAIYRFGQGVPADPTEALRWYRRAAETGDQDARLQLTLVLLTGDGIEMDVEDGRRVLLELADEGVGQAQFLAGRAYLEGLWLERDLRKAREMMAQAAANGVNEARAYVVWIDRAIEGGTAN